MRIKNNNLSKNIINDMKHKQSFTKIAQAYFLLFVSGWRDVEVFGHPPVYNKKNIITYLVTSGDGTIIDHCQYYGNRKDRHEWQQAGVSSEMYPDYRYVRLWKPMTHLRRWSFYACR